MKTNHKNIISLAITLQTLILLIAAVTNPAAATIDDPAVPQLPVVLYGNVEINGEPAPIGTIITAELNNEVVAETVVDCEGICGNCPENRLNIACDTDDLANLKFYVSGVEAVVDMDVIETASYGDVEKSYFIATTSGSSSDGTKSSGGSGGTSYSYSTSTTDEGVQDEAISGTNSEKTSSRSTLESTVTDQSGESSKQIPAPEEESSVGTVGLIAVGGIVLLGAILAFRYGLKAN